MKPDTKTEMNRAKTSIKIEKHGELAGDFKIKLDDFFQTYPAILACKG